MSLLIYSQHSANATPNTPNNNAPSFNMAMLNVNEKVVVGAQARPHLIEKGGGRCVLADREAIRANQAAVAAIRVGTKFR